MDKKGISEELLAALGAMLAAVFVIQFYGIVGGKEVGLLHGINSGALNQNFDLLNTKVGALLGRGRAFDSGKLSLALLSGSAIVAFNPDQAYVEYSISGSERKKIHKPDMLPSSPCAQACLCLYENRDSWGSYKDRHKDVRCEPYDRNTFFYSKESDSDNNAGAPLLLPQKISGKRNYENLVIYGKGFGTRAMYVETQKVNGKEYVYISELDPVDEADRREKSDG